MNCVNPFSPTTTAKNQKENIKMKASTICIIRVELEIICYERIHLAPVLYGMEWYGVVGHQ